MLRNALSMNSWWNRSIQPDRIRFRARPIINRLIIWIDIDRSHGDKGRLCGIDISSRWNCVFCFGFDRELL